MKEINPAIESTSNIRFPVVGIGASAGGLEAIKTFIQSIPRKSGMAFVFVQHLSSGRESALPEILKKISKIPVLEVSDEINLEKDHFYTIPSNKILITVDGKLKLGDKKQQTKTIDIFLSSLGVVHQSYSVGIILSGALNDGTLGLQVIKTYGGITLAQDERSAAFDDMPKSAVKAGAVDFILPPEDMVGKLIKLNRPFHEDYSKKEITENIPKRDEEIFKQLLTVIRVRRGVDFSSYKASTLKRRIVRRMAINKIEQPDKYLALLRESSAEQDALYNDMLISVTSFFRDSATFELLCSTIFPALLSQKRGSNTLRIWVAGCATGEEAYSMAMCLLEFLGDKAAAMKIRIFATDISEIALAKARTGIYRASELEGVSPSRLRQFFNKLDGNYQVEKSIRDMCVFAQHNLLKDPPFSQIDLVSCRNVLIYLEPVLQKRALNTFHYSLNEKGFLMLGKAESIGNSTDVFRPYNSQEKIYSRVGPRGRFMNVTSRDSEQAMSDRDQHPALVSDKNVFKLADDLLLASYTPAGVLVNENYDILQFRGNTEAWLAPSPGKASLNVLKMARAGLAFEIRSLLAMAKKSGSPVRKDALFFKNGKEQLYVNLEVVPISESNVTHYLVLFQNSLVRENNSSHSLERRNFDQQIGEDPRELHIKQLEKELIQVREDMRSITEMQEAANEELLSSNQELLSSSEELQSLNEELETSKEELQSTNEEIIIVNKELVERNEQLNTFRNYTEAIVNTIRDPLLILDKDLRVLRATEGFYTRFKVSESDTEGKFLYELGSRQWDIPELLEQLEKVLAEKKSFKDFEVKQDFPVIGPNIMCLNARQIESLGGEDLILLSIEDITYKRKVEQGLAEVEMLLEEYTERLRFATLAAELGTWDYNIQTKELITDKRCRELFELNGSQPANLKEYGSQITEADKVMIREIYEATSHGQGDGTYELELRIQNPEIKSSKWLKLKGKTYFEKQQPTFISGIVQDITPQKDIEEEMKNLLKKKDEFISVASHELKTPITTIKGSLQLAERYLHLGENADNVYPLVKKANTNLSKLTHLLSLLLDATNIQAGRLVLNKAYFDFQELIRECQEQIESMYVTHKIIVEGEPHNKMFGDKARIEQVIINLLTNAVKYSPGHDRVMLRVSNTGPNIKTEIQDFGIGIPSKDLSLIFNRFYRVQESSANYAGLGLGLYISSEIISRHNGEMGIDSKPGDGTTVWFSLPLV